MFSRFIVACVRISCLSKAEYYSTAYLYHIFFIHLSTDGHLACFHLLTVMNNATITIGVQGPVQVPV